jgi:hypothetical protein
MNTKYTKVEIAHTMVMVDFINSFNMACELAGGGSWESLKTKTLEECMHILAPNGIRMAHYNAANINEIEISDDLLATINMINEKR